MAEKPILFSAPMVRAILDGSKTQTRRVINPQPVSDGGIIRIEKDKTKTKKWLFASNSEESFSIGLLRSAFKPPYGEVGDLLWVREEHFRFGHWEEVHGIRTKTGRQKWKFVADTDETHFINNFTGFFRKGRHHHDPYTPAWHKRLARFMPKSLTVNWLEITAIRVERLHSISRGDSMEEGCPFQNLNGTEIGKTNPVWWFKELWKCINGEKSWDKNPWVWVIEFKVVKP